MSVSSTALPKLTEAPFTPFCQFWQFLTWGFAKTSLAFSAARTDKNTDDQARTANGGFSLTPAAPTDKLDKRPGDSAKGWGAEDVVGEIVRPKSGARINFRRGSAGENTRENAVQWITCAILHRRDVPFDNSRRHAPAVEAALTLPAVVEMVPKEGG